MRGKVDWAKRPWDDKISRRRGKYFGYKCFIKIGFKPLINIYKIPKPTGCPACY
jgi:hypothetical protein